MAAARGAFTVLGRGLAATARGAAVASTSRVLLRLPRAAGRLPQATLPSCRAGSTVAAAWHPDYKSDDPLATAVGSERREAMLGQEADAMLARLRITMNDKSLLVEALTPHATDRLVNQLRLSVLGSAIIESTLAEYIFLHFPNLPKYAFRSLLQRAQSTDELVAYGRSIGLNHCLRTSNPTDSKFGAKHEEGLAFQALVAAVHVDQGSRAARELVKNIVVARLLESDIDTALRLTNPRLTLQRIMKANNKRFRTEVVAESGRKSHFPTFHVAVYCDDAILGEGTSYSKKKAETAAFEATLRQHFAKELAEMPLPSMEDDYIPEATDSLHGEEPEVSAKQ